ncbi:MAG: nucleoside 2-deoxyribosyltransferase [Rhodomicrobiaceae bacterium]
MDHQHRSSGKPRVYIAGPMVFYPNAAEHFHEMKQILQDTGLEGCAPLDNQLGLEGATPGRELARAIYEADEALMRDVDAAIFNLDPFRRGTEMDAGTAFEVGYCRALGLPLAGWTTDARPYPEKVRDFMKEAYRLDLHEGAPSASGATSGALRDADGILVHSEGLYQNLMIQMAIEAAGGAVFAAPDWRTAFGEAARHLAKLPL